MKKLFLVAALLAQAGWVSAENGPAEGQNHTDEIILGGESAPITVEDDMFYIQTGNTRIGYDSFERAQKAARSAGMENLAIERRKELANDKDALGLGELERAALSTQNFRDLVPFRGANTDQLFALLDDPAFAGSRHSIAYTIGVVGDEPAAKKLATYLSSPTPIKSHGDQLEHARVLSSGIPGLVAAAHGRSMPWIYDYLVDHADPDQWKDNFKGVEIGEDSARHFASITASAISRIEDVDPLPMLHEVRERRLAKVPVQTLTVGENGRQEADELEYVDIAIRQAKRQAEARNNFDHRR